MAEIDSRISKVAEKVLNAAKDSLGDKLEKVILFGSYARGDFDDYSDVDFFVLADVPHEDTPYWRENIDNHIPNFLFDYDLLVCVHLTSKAMFDRFFDVLPFYQNVIREGIVLNG